jgi:hypothetical protein
MLRQTNERKRIGATLIPTSPFCKSNPSVFGKKIPLCHFADKRWAHPWIVSSSAQSEPPLVLTSSSPI